MIKKLIAAAVVIAAVAAVVVLVLPRFRKQERFAAPVSLPVVETELPVTGDIRLTTSLPESLRRHHLREYQGGRGGDRG